MKPMRALSVILLVLTLSYSGAAQINSWTNPTSASWESPFWSAGVLPSAAQHAMITNSGFKAVGISAQTVANFPGTLTVSNLTVSASTNGFNTLLLNYSGTTLPLQVLNESTIGSNGRLLNLYSSFKANGPLTINRGEFAQEGGVTSASNSFVSVIGGSMNVTNADLVLGTLQLTEAGRFLQSGGSVSSSSGTLGFGDTRFSLMSGTLRVGAWNFVDGEISHSGGLHVVTNDLVLRGHYRDDHGFITSNAVTYTLSGGNLVSPSMLLDFLGFVNQSGGSNRITGSLIVSNTSYTLTGGMLSNANTIVTVPSAAFEQTGGTHIIGDTLLINNPVFYFSSVYRLSGGTLSVPTIDLQGPYGILAVSNTPTINNARVRFKEGVLHVAGSSQFGQLALTSNGVIRFGSGPGVVRFLDSTSVSWNSNSRLLVTNWAGSVTGGGMHQLYIGSNSSSLTAAQLSRIRFVNPPGKLKGLYPAVILASGEIVRGPDNAVLVGGWGAENPFDPQGTAFSESLIVYPGISSNVVEISASALFSLALGADGTVFAWGPVIPPPNPTASLTGVVAISTGGYDAMVLHSNGTVTAWGYNYDGETNVPPGLSNVIAISSGTLHSLALRADGTIVGWGFNGTGNLTSAPPAAMPAKAISAGNFHNLALRRDNGVVAWGDGPAGIVPPGLTDVVAVHAGNNLSLALKSDGTVVAWGDDLNHQADVPPGLSNVIALSAGDSHVLALKADGTVVAWGNSNLSGETMVPPWLTNVRAISAGGNFSLVLLYGGPHAQVRITNPIYEAGIGTFKCYVPTRSGHVYRLEYRDNLTIGGWIPLPLTAGAGDNETPFFHPSTFAPQRFYRIRDW